MKNIYKVIGILIVLTLIMVGCSSEDPEPTEADVEEPSQVEDNIAEEEEVEEIEDPIEEAVEEEEEEQELETAEEAGEELKSKVLRDIMNMDQYTMKMKRITNMGGRELEATVTTVVSGDQTATIMDGDGTQINVIEKDDKSYVIMHDSKMIIVSDRYEEEEGTEPDGSEVVFDDLEYVGKGQGNFLGNARPYEEYKMKLGRVLYYFDGDELDGMEMFIDMTQLLDEEERDMEESSVIIDVESIEEEVDMSVFELPEDYQVVGQ